MSEQDRDVYFRSLIIVLAFSLAWTTGCRKKRTESAPGKQTAAAGQHDPNGSEADPVEATGNSPKGGRTKAVPGEWPKANATRPAKKSLKEIVRDAEKWGGWGPAFEQLYGMTAPEFTLKDTEGKTHKLSDYRGKEVMIIFWATWCGPCRIEMPHLIALRNRFSREKLAMLAIASENPSVDNASLIKRIAKDLNYTVLLEKDNMPKPFGVMQVYTTIGIPCSFFINPEGKIKFATVGPLTLGDMRAIIEAE